MTSTSPTPPDISGLSISQQQPRLHDSSYDYDALQVGHNQRQQQFHFSTSPAIPGQMPYNPLGLGQSPLKNKPTARAGLPAQWIDSQVLNDSRSMSPPTNSDISSGGSPPLHQMQVPMQTPPIGGADDEIIPTAIVIKNIPFNVKRETLLDIIASLAIPTPYAFNYHLDTQGAFRGLAFANFRQPSDADAVVAALNGFDVQGRKLRVEYKKVLQAGEKERIEREKALRRMRSMQLEKEQQAMHQQQPTPLDEFGPVGGPMYGTPRSVSTPYTNPFQQQQPNNSPPMPVPQPYGVASPVAPPPPSTPSTRGSSTELDLNDASTLEIYSRILLFKDDHMRDELAFSRTLSPKQRRVVHLVAQKLGVYHYSVGEGEERYAVVTRIDPERVNHPMQAEPRRTLSRAPSAYNMAAPQVSASSLRTKKSMPDMKTLHTQAPRLTSRASNGNIREGYATIASPSRRSPGGFGSLFANNTFSGSAVPPVPSLPTSLSGSLNMNGNGMIREGEVSGSNVVRQPRGPTGGGGFGARRDRVSASEGAGRGLEARSHEPLEI